MPLLNGLIRVKSLNTQQININLKRASALFLYNISFFTNNNFRGVKMKIDKNNKKVVYHYEANKKNKQNQFEEEFANEFNFEDRQLELLKKQNRQLSKEANKKSKGNSNKTA